VTDAAPQTTASALAPSPGASSVCSPAQRCLFAGLKPLQKLQPGSSSNSSTVHGTAHAATPEAVDRVAVDRWLQAMEMRHGPSTPGGEVSGEAALPPPAFVVLQLLG
jgi:hypothetical protein